MEREVPPWKCPTIWIVPQWWEQARDKKANHLETMGRKATELRWPESLCPLGCRKWANHWKRWDAKLIRGRKKWGLKRYARHASPAAEFTYSIFERK